jgi:hypothetical protein
MLISWSVTANVLNTPSFDIFYSCTNRRFLMFDKFYLPDIFIGIAIIVTYPYNFCTEFIKIHTVLLFIRFSCVITTSGYVSARYYKSYKTCKSHNGFLNKLHTDLVISGHAIYKTLCILFIIHNCSLFYNLIAVPALAFGIITNLLVGDHYTSDIILGIALPILAYY